MFRDKSRSNLLNNKTFKSFEVEEKKDFTELQYETKQLLDKYQYIPNTNLTEEHPVYKINELLIKDSPPNNKKLFIYVYSIENIILNTLLVLLFKHNETYTFIETTLNNYEKTLSKIFENFETKPNYMGYIEREESYILCYNISNLSQLNLVNNDLFVCSPISEIVNYKKINTLSIDTFVLDFFMHNIFLTKLYQNETVLSSPILVCNEETTNDIYNKSLFTSNMLNVKLVLPINLSNDLKKTFYLLILDNFIYTQDENEFKKQMEKNKYDVIVFNNNNNKEFYCKNMRCISFFKA